MEADSGPQEFVERLRNRICKDGPLTFADFMESALYDPEFGYYGSAAARIGPGGDYSTSSETHPVFAEFIGKQIRELAGAIAPTGQFAIVEMGAGKGTFAGHLLDSYGRHSPGLLARLRYVIIERSAGMMQRQQLRLLPHLQAGIPIEWHSDLGSLDAQSLTGVCFSNELVDSFPVHRMVKRSMGLREIFVGWSRGGFLEVEAPPSSPELDAYFDRLGVRLKDGQVAEVNLKALDWIRDVANRLRRGVVLTVDYGHTAADLYAPIRRAGTLLCYYRGRVSDSPYERVGRQDMTAHVDFTSLALAGEEAGLTATGFTNQLNFLIGLGIESAFAAQDLDPSASAWMRSLLRPDGMGTTYKILIQHKGIPAPQLAGLRCRPYVPDALYQEVSSGQRESEFREASRSHPGRISPPAKENWA
jgi:SAM-dependent MidA family methyltransferase